MKIEGKKYLNINSYDKIIIDNKTIKVKSDKVLNSNNSDFTDSLIGIRDEDIILEVVKKYLNDHIITNISTSLKYGDREYYLVSSIDGVTLRIYGFNPTILELIKEKYNIDRYSIIFAQEKDNYIIDTSNKNSSYELKDNDYHIKLLKNNNDKIDNMDDEFIKRLLYDLIQSETYPSYNNNRCILNINGKTIQMSLSLYKKYMNLIDEINNKLEDNNKLQLKMKGWK